MEYRCQTEPVGNLIQTHPQCLCDSCASRDCTNPIQELSMSIVGITIKGRFYMRGNDPYFVTSCEGYVECQDAEKEK